MGASDSSVVFSSFSVAGIEGDDTMTLNVFDTEQGTSQDIDVTGPFVADDVVPLAVVHSGGLGSDGRLYFGVDDAGGGLGPISVWSVAMPDGSDLRSEGTGSAFDADGDFLAFVEGSSVRVRNLSTGDESEVATLGEGCDDFQLLQVGGEVLTLLKACADGNAPIRVMTTAGEPIVTLTGGFNIGATTDRFVSVQGDGKTAGSYVYDVETERLLRLSDVDALPSSAMVGTGDLLTWVTPREERDVQVEVATLD